jgi:hypothetical protein
MLTTHPTTSYRTCRSVTVCVSVSVKSTTTIMKETDGRDMSQAEVAELEALFAKYKRVKAFPVSHPQVDIPASMQEKVVYFVRHAEGK